MKRTKNLLRAMVIVMVLVLMHSTTAFADDETRFVGGTTVNGVKISGLTVEEAEASLAQYYAGEYKLALITKKGTEEYISADALGYQAAVPAAALKEILDGQNAAGRVTGPAAQSSYTIAVSGSFDREKLAQEIGKLNCVSGPDVKKTENARISDYQEGQAFTIIPEVLGNDLNVEKMTVAAEAALSSGQTSLNLAEADCYYKVSVRADNGQLKELCKRMNKYKDVKITYSFGEEIKEELSGVTFTPWLSVAEDGQVTVKEEEVAAYIQALAAKYDTAGKVRTFQSINGKEAQLTGPYGWKLDQAAETAALTEMIKTGESQTREPQFTQAAAAYGDQDWGSTYVEIDLSGQHVYMIREGVLVWDAPCVTGNVSKNYTTPEGIYGLTYKEQDRILRGKKKADGSYEYESHVDYWMPFNGGIGLHDANWRGSFGGAIYQTNGSHGCINLPPERAVSLYDMVYKGMPVICYM